MSSAVESEWETTFKELWWDLGPATKDAILELLPEGWRFDGKRILDFGCGPGRTLRHFLPETERAEIWGIDVDGESIGELRETLVPPFHVAQCGVAPPLELESGSVDLAWAISVFTHLTDNSIPWLLELHRVLAPAGLLIATYMGRWTSEFIAREPWDEDRIGMNVLRHNAPWEQGGPLVLISDWWMREHWGRAFEVLSVAERIHNQSWALLRRRDVELTAEQVLRPGGDEREYIALRHNLRQVQRELEDVQVQAETGRRAGAEAMAELRRSYEESKSWQLTRPLREVGERVRSHRARP